MANWFFRIRDTQTPPIGSIVRWVPKESFLYFNAIVKVNEVGFCEGIISTAGEEDPIIKYLGSREGNLDFILEVWFEPGSRTQGRHGGRQLFGLYLTRYVRHERLNDGRPRFTFSGKSILDLLDRPLIYPDATQDMATTDSDPTSIPTAKAKWIATPWVPAVAETFTGGPALSDTKYQMEACVEQAKLTNPEPFLGFTNPAPSNGGGIPDHAISLRFKQLLVELQGMAGASWYSAGPQLQNHLPVDFGIVPVTAGTGWPLEFKTFPGGRGTDRTIGNGTVNPVVFDARTNSVILPVDTLDKRSAVNRFIVGGEGTGVDREVSRVEQSVFINSGGSPFNTRERFYSGQNIRLFPDGLEEVSYDGWKELRDKGHHHTSSIVPTQVGSLLYGLDYFLGDRCSVSHAFTGEGKHQTLVVFSVDIKLFNHSAGKTGGAAGSHEQFTVEFIRPDGRRANGVAGLRRTEATVNDRLKALEEAEESIGANI